MKKLALYLLAVSTLTFTSCEVEPVGEEGLESVEGKWRKNKKKKKKRKRNRENEECTVSVLPELPAMVNACTTAKGVNANNIYFDLTINDTSLAGDYGAWCVDVDLSLTGNECFDADVYSSYAELPAGAFENPDNFDLINWIINQNYIGMDSSSGETYTFGDVQWAIWELIDNQNCVACAFLGDDWSVTKGQEIVDAALASGEGFEPGEGQLLAVVLIPTNNRQPVFISIPLECESEPKGGCETAFARGNDGNTCFRDEGFSRWGWTIGPLSEGADESYDIYAGAGQCDISKGELVGTVDVSYEDGEVTVVYNIDDAYDVQETHTYAGNEMFPINRRGNYTVAPGKYEIEEDLSGDIYVIAHAVVCSGEGDDDDDEWDED
ncbi:thioester domain-containing protein [Flagellimonas myxillae]|uniref:thioester domain-containing protein n=1 Tax=Flagellimonas myxillae TaxID=2942214 RepID=UPI00201F4988|nr:thioester domain-containing protein [Muricauda myxillae]MCL6266210.1 thioester domain-containing protein [Muricauda myxillae]